MMILVVLLILGHFILLLENCQWLRVILYYTFISIHHVLLHVHMYVCACIIGRKVSYSESRPKRRSGETEQRASQVGEL